MRPGKIARLINEKCNVDFPARIIYDKARKLGLERARIVSPRRSSAAADKALKLPPLTTALHFPIGTLLDRINAVVPRHLSRDHRDDVIGEMALAVYEGRLDEADIPRRVREFVNAGYRCEHNKHGPLSLSMCRSMMAVR